MTTQPRRFPPPWKVEPHPGEYSVLGSDFGNDMIYVGYLAFMWGTISLARWLDYLGVALPRA